MKKLNASLDNHVFRFECFESVLELERVISGRKFSESWKCKSENFDDDIKDDSSWYGVSSLKEAYDLLKNGWQEATQKSAGMLNDLRQCGNREKVSFSNDVVGFCPNVPLSLMNVPNSMINTAKKSVKNRVLNIIYFNTASCGVSSKDMIKAGINIVNALIDVEKSGYRVNLTVGLSFCRDGNCYGAMVDIKNANQSLNLLKMMFPIAHSAWLRGIGFEWLYKSEAPYMSGNGQPLYVYLEDNNISVEDVENKVFKGNTVMLDYKIAKNGVEEIKNVLKRKM